MAKKKISLQAEVLRLSRIRKREFRRLGRLIESGPNPAGLESLAEEIGVTPATLSRWENRKIRPHAITLRAWREAVERLKEK